MIILGLFVQDGDLGFQVRRLNISDQTPLKPGAQPLFDRINVLGQAVRRNHDLLVLFVQSIEGVKKFFLGAFLAGYELNIVNQENVHRMKTLAEAEHFVEAQGVDHFNGEFFSADVAEARGGIALFDHVADGMHQVGLAHAHSTIEKQRVVGFGGLFGNGARRRVGKLVGLAYDEGLERVARVELVIAAFKIKLGLLGGRGGNNGRRRGYRFFLRANVLHAGVGNAQLVKNGFDDFPVGAGEHLAEHTGGNLHKENFTFDPRQPGGLKPGAESVDADARLHALKKSVPKVSSFTFLAKLDSRRHQSKKPSPRYFHKCVNPVERQFQS